jgi:hypothetical protein
MMAVICAQFLSAFGDNALLFATLALMRQLFQPAYIARHRQLRYAVLASVAQQGFASQFIIVHTNPSLYSKGMMAVICAQFLSAFGDNALLFATPASVYRAAPPAPVRRAGERSAAGLRESVHYRW